MVKERTHAVIWGRAGQTEGRARTEDRGVRMPRVSETKGPVRLE